MSTTGLEVFDKSVQTTNMEGKSLEDPNRTSRSNAIWRDSCFRAYCNGQIRRARRIARTLTGVRPHLGYPTGRGRTFGLDLDWGGTCPGEWSGSKQRSPVDRACP